MVFLFLLFFLFFSILYPTGVWKFAYQRPKKVESNFGLGLLCVNLFFFPLGGTRNLGLGMGGDWEGGGWVMEKGKWEEQRDKRERDDKWEKKTPP